MNKYICLILSILILSISGCDDDLPSNPEASQRWVDWHIEKTSTDSYLYDVLIMDSISLVVGEKSTILASGHGDSWIVNMYGLADDIRSVLWTGDRFVAVGACVLTSNDASDWNASSGDYDMYDVALADTVLIGVGENIYRSYDNGKTWEDVAILRGRCYGVAWSGSKLVTAGFYYENDGTHTALCQVSTEIDGTGWTTQHFHNPGSFLDVTWTGSQFILVGSDGVIKTSSDGEQWEDRDSGTLEHLWGVSSLNDSVVVVGLNGTILTSADGIDWIARNSGTSNHFYGVSASDTRIIAAGSNGTILVSE